MDRVCYGSKRLIDKFIKSLTEINEDSKGKIFQDQSNSEIWQLIVVQEERPRKYVLARKFPELTYEELISRTLNSGFDDEAEACLDLLLNMENYENIEFRDRLVNLIEKKIGTALTGLDKRRLKHIIVYTELTRSENRRTIFNKSYEKIVKDIDFYKQFAYRAQRALEELER